MTLTWYAFFYYSVRLAILTLFLVSPDKLDIKDTDVVFSIYYRLKFRKNSEYYVRVFIRRGQKQCRNGEACRAVNTMLVPFDIEFMRQDRKQRAKDEACRTVRERTPY